MTIGIAIPNFVKYKPLMTRLLYNISKQTVLPDKVSVAMSECEWQPDKEYPFEIVTDCSDDVRSLAVNTNLALSNLPDCEVLTIMHGDDLMHPQRNQLLLWAFTKPEIKAVVHGFKYVKRVPRKMDKFDDVKLRLDYLCTLPEGKAYPMPVTGECEYLNGHLSFRREVWEQYKYDEAPEWFYYADTEYTSRLVRNGIFLSYIPQPLVYYFKDNTWIR
jgi:hypothetical protein